MFVLHLTALILGLRRVNLKKQSALDTDRLGFLEGLRTAGIGRMAKYGWGNQRRRVLPLGNKCIGNPNVFFRIRHSRCRKVDRPLGQYGAYAAGFYGLGHCAFIEIPIAAGGRSAKQHFSAGQ